MIQNEDFMVVEGMMSTNESRRYIIIDPSTGETLDDARGYGYKTADKAIAAFKYKHNSYNSAVRLAKRNAIQSRPSGEPNHFMERDTYYVFVNGTCSGNQAPGGYAALVIKNNDMVSAISGGESQTTTHRMELTALIDALLSLETACKVRVFSDSKYIVNSLVEGWAKAWQNHGWKKIDGTMVANSDLWETLLCLDEKYQPEYTLVHDRTDNKYSEMCCSRSIVETLKHSV